MVGGPTNLRLRLHLGLEVPEVPSSTSQPLGTESLNQSPLGSEPFKQPLEAKGSSTLTNPLANALAVVFECTSTHLGLRATFVYDVLVKPADGHSEK